MASATMPRLLAVGNPTAAGENFYQTPTSNIRAVIRTIKITNLDASPHTLSLWTMPSSGASPADANQIYKEIPIPANTTVTKEVTIILGVTSQFGKIHTQADADSVLSVSIHGSEVTVADLSGRSEPSQLAQLQIGSTVTQILGAADPNRLVAVTLLFCNTDSGPHDLSVWNLINQFASADDSCVIVDAATIAAGETLEITAILCFMDQQYLMAQADAPSVITCTVYGNTVDVS